jgi:hypothetical protein
MKVDEEDAVAVMNSLAHPAGDESGAAGSAGPTCTTSRISAASRRRQIEINLCKVH